MDTHAAHSVCSPPRFGDRCEIGLWKVMSRLRSCATAPGAELPVRSVISEAFGHTSSLIRFECAAHVVGQCDEMQMRIVVDETDIADAVEAHPGFERRDHAFDQGPHRGDQRVMAFLGVAQRRSTPMRRLH
jgi:hypothetical protein